MVSKKEKYLAAAQKLLERGQLDKALVELGRVVHEDPKDTRTWLKMAELHAKRGAAADATGIYLKTAELYGEQGFAQKAVAVYKNVLKLSPGTVAAHLKLGMLYKQLGLVSDSVQQMELAAAALQRAGKAADAVAALRQAVEVQPDNIVLRVKLAESASQAAMTEEAVREFARAADQLKAQGRSDEYLRVVERLLFHQPENFTRARELSEAYIAKGSPRLALPKLQACLKADPRDPRTLSLLAKALEQLGQVPKAVSVLKELVRLAAELGRASERDAAILRALTLDPTDPELQAAAARHQLRGGAGTSMDATPPPRPLPHDGQAGGSFDLSGAMRLPGAGGGASGRVSAPMGGSAGAASAGRLSLSSAGGTPSPEQALARILAESEVFMKYGLLERAADHLARVFTIDQGHRAAREKLIAVLDQLGRNADGDHHRAVLAQTPAPGEMTATLEVDDGIEVEVMEEEDDPASGLVTPPPALAAALRAQAAALAALTPPPRVVERAPASRSAAASGVGTPAADPADELAAMSPTPAPLFADAGGPPTPAPVFPERAEAPPTPAPAPMFPARAAGTQAAVAPLLPMMPMPDPGDDDDDFGAGFGGGGSADVFPTRIDDQELVAELAQADFFIEQSMADDARTVLEDLRSRFPEDPRVMAKLSTLGYPPAVGRAGGGGSGPTEPIGAIPAAFAPAPALAVPAPAAPVPTPPPASLSSAAASARRDLSDTSLLRTPAPRAIVADGEAGDLSTHADLGIAYKEMGLWDAAISEFKLLAQDPLREVFALTMMGECYEAKGSITEAVIRYKRALNCDDVSETENLDLYFLLGCAFERLGDVGEALYFFEKVAKRDARFRDVDRKLAELRPRMAKRA